MLPVSVRRLTRRLSRLGPVMSDYVRDEVHDSRPSVLILAPAARCNATCTFCFDYKRIPPQTTSLAQFSKILDKLSPQLELVDFSYFGEPMLNPQLPDLVRHARERGLGTILYSNGMLLDDERSAALVASGIDIVVINLNAWTKDYKVTGPDVLPERRVQQVNAFMRACAPSTLVVLQIIAPAGRASIDRRALARRFDDPGNRLLRVKSEENYRYDGPTRRGAGVRCFRPFEEITVAPDGEVLVCCKDMLRKSSFGNILTEDLETVWVERMNPLRKRNAEALCLRCEVPGDSRRFLASVLLSPLGARKLYLRVASMLF